MLPPLLEKWRYRARYQRKWVVIAAVALVFLTLPFWAGPLARMVAVSVVSKRTGLQMSVGTSRVWYTRVVFEDVQVVEAGEGKTPLAVMQRLVVPIAAAWGGAAVHIEGATFEIERGGPTDNVSGLLGRLRGRPATGEATSEPRK